MTAGNGVRDSASVADGLKPLDARVFSRKLECQMRKPAVVRGAVPMLDAGGNGNDGSGRHLDQRVPPGLIIVAAADANQYLPAVFLCLMDMPMIPAARLEGDVVDWEPGSGNEREIASAFEILRIDVIRRTDREKDRFLICVFLGERRVRRCPDVFCQAERRPGFRPAGVKRGVRQRGGDFIARYAFFFRVLKMMTERGVRDSLRHERDDGQEAAGFQIDSAAVPVFAEQDIVVIMCEIGGEIAERVPACGLYDFFLYWLILSQLFLITIRSGLELAE